MNLCLRIVITIHTALIRLFPPGFRSAFGSEIKAVFSQTAWEAAGQGAFTLGMFFLRELADLPAAALREHLLERRATARDPGLRISQPLERLSCPEMLVALAVFLIPAGLILLNTAPPAMVGKVIPPVLGGVLLIGSVTGALKRFPRWSLPYFGLVLSAIVFLFLFQWEAERIATSLASRFVVQPSDDLGRLLLAIFWEGVIWLSLLTLACLIILPLVLLRRFRPLVRRWREDWSQLSYLLYGGATLALVLTFDEYRYEGPFALAGLLCLVVGAWGYLRASRPGQGLIALLAGVTLSMWIAALGVWLLVPLQDWTNWFRWHPPESERWFEAGQTLIGWVWMVLVLAIPALLRFRRRPADPLASP